MQTAYALFWLRQTNSGDQHGNRPVVCLGVQVESLDVVHLASNRRLPSATTSKTGSASRQNAPGRYADASFVPVPPLPRLLLGRAPGDIVIRPVKARDIHAACVPDDFPPMPKMPTEVGLAKW